MKDSHLTLRLPADLARALERWARSKRLPKSEVARDAVERYLSPAPTPAASPMLVARDLAARWPLLPRLTPAEADDFAADLAAGRSTLPAVRSSWD